MSKKFSLIGCGIKIIAHLTKEAESHIKKADEVLYLVNESVMEEWIRTHSKKSKNLSSLYFSQVNRLDSYYLITQEILAAAEYNNFLCVVLYGHPTVFAIPGIEAIKKAKALGVETKILPAISAEDCLFADLEIDPASCGCYSVEATDLIIYQRQIDISSHLIIWQIGIIGNLGHDTKVKKDAVELFKNYLLNFYSKGHNAIIYEASLYPGIESTKKIKLEELTEESLSKLSTLYIPPEIKKEANSFILNKLGFKE